MNHLAAEWEKSRGVGGREDGRPDLADDSVNGVITTIPLSLQHKQEVTDQAALPPPPSPLLCFIYVSHLSVVFFPFVWMKAAACVSLSVLTDVTVLRTSHRELGGEGVQVAAISNEFFLLVQI